MSKNLKERRKWEEHSRQRENCIANSTISSTYSRAFEKGKKVSVNGLERLRKRQGSVSSKRDVGRCAGRY